MEKKEYFNTLLKRDFIRYVLLKEPEYTDEEISGKLKSKIDVDLLYQRLKSLFYQIVNKHLSPERVKSKDGKVVNKLPSWLTIELSDEIIEEYKALIAKEYTAVNFMPGILSHIERLTRAQGVDDMAHNLRRFVADLKQMSTHMANIGHVSKEDYRLAEKYEDAERITLREHLMQDNGKDIMIFLEALTEYCKDRCRVELSLQLSRLYADIAASTEIDSIIKKFDSIHSAAKNEYEKLSGLESVEEWDKEYRQRLPMDFFERNVEDINAAKAFHMVLLLALSRHEEELKHQGYIDPKGEIILFTNPRYDGNRWEEVNYSMFG